MKLMLKSSAVAALTIVALAVSALPAAAFDIVMFTGTMQACADTVYDQNGNPNPMEAPCPLVKKDGSTTGKNGLYWSGHPGGNAVRYGNYRFASGGHGLPFLPPCLKHNAMGDIAPVVCQIKVEGKLAPVDVNGQKMGAACDISSGHSGEGWIRSPAENGGNGSKATLWDVGWLVTAGSTIPFSGHYYFKDQKRAVLEDVKKPRRGLFVGFLQVQGNQQCTKSNATGRGGQANFNVFGVVVMTDQDNDPNKQPPEKKYSWWRPKN